MINFDKIKIEVEGTGIIANSASLSTSASLADIKSVGKIGTFNQIPSGPKTSFLQFSYLIDMNKEPNLIIADEIKNTLNDLSYLTPTISIGGVSGQGYLSSFSLNGNPNSPIQANVNYTIFDELSGYLQESETVESGDFVDRSIAHGWGLVVNTVSGYREEPALNFSYNLQNVWRPTYSVGQSNPIQVNLDGSNEVVSLTQSDYEFIQYSGENVEGVLLDSSNPTIQLKDINLACAGNGIDLLQETGNMKTFNLEGSKITANQFGVTIDNIAKTTYTIRKSH
tara:strand:+ start:16454 stop:17299 length:846 start_codon:yes stop_codon:yes gene_type:complete